MLQIPDCDSSGSNDSSDQKTSFTKKFYSKNLVFKKNLQFFFATKNFTKNSLKLGWNSTSQIVIKLKNSDWDETQKLKLWLNQIVTKLKKLKLGQN